ncbi:FAD-binding oxidoreductase [Rhodococcus sp. 06-462-5]|uniref:FAD-binding oxidoreductase n=1 Tax=Nocardiaceae TaxID=85025 RepID=UPI0009B929C0|nr:MULTISPECIES: FAD-linked oxidase C-terminal domain-containing protein [Rhodococcus]OZC74125.1 FAD-binding oxidoreductase [Rhodococcus sp. 06-462-5]OZE68186.1 FAD-binding oxidoreductase [Rhodococcus sp. 02-925g]OZF51500.1 FAD-binding oxidoreductase [Rhodococcus sp. 14-1411-2a]
MTAVTDTDFVGELKSNFGRKAVFDNAALSSLSIDRSGWEPEGSPVAAVFAESTGDVSALLKAAGRFGVPVVTRGAGTGLSGGAVARSGEVVLSLERMNSIVELSEQDQIVRAQAGVITADIDSAAARVGLRYAPDPGSVAISTIGGNIATNAGGLRCAKYGVTKDSVLGLEVVLADGRVVRTGGRTVKGVAGYDLTSLIVGSEGTLGVVTEATLRLRPAPASTDTVAAFFGSVGEAAAAASAITAAGLQPSVCELLDFACLRAIDAAEGTALSARGNAFLLVQADGAGSGPEAALIEGLLGPLAKHVERSVDAQSADELVRIRRGALPALERLGRVLIEDIAVPRSQLGPMTDRIERIADAHGVTVATMAHAGDGNLHPIFVVPSGEIPAEVWTAAGEVFGAALEFGGTLTGEHGVGLLKQQWLGDEIGSDVSELMHGIKSVFDPSGILNPGKALPTR